jgi:acyl-CoA reductase-like NAD-dependent aldehyde dehydrogenase
MRTDRQCEMHHDPFGVTLIIWPWNEPFELTFLPLVAAIDRK